MEKVRVGEIATVDQIRVYARLTMPDPPLPSFVIAGAMRSGTTALTSWLRGEPTVFMAPTKELHYFDRNYERGLDWYAGHFVGADRATAIGEATPNYLYHPKALDRLARDLPDAKLILLLREPVSRAYSHYLHRRSRQEEPLSFEQAVAAEADRLRTGDELTRAHFSYVDRGRYLHQLERLFALFPREAVLIHLFEDLRDNPAAVFASVTAFIGVDATVQPSAVGEQVNAYQEFRSIRLRQLSRRLPHSARRVVGRLNRVQNQAYPGIPEDVRARLAEEYLSERANLEQLLGRRLDVWS